MKTMLTTILNTYSKVIQVTLYVKKWWNREIAEAQKIWAKERKKWGHTSLDRERLKKC